MAQPTDEGKIEVFPESETVFFLKPAKDATVTFVKDDKGKVTHIVLHRDGRDTRAKRLDDESEGRRGQIARTDKGGTRFWGQARTRRLRRAPTAVHASWRFPIRHSRFPIIPHRESRIANPNHPPSGIANANSESRLGCGQRPREALVFRVAKHRIELDPDVVHAGMFQVALITGGVGLGPRGSARFGLLIRSNA